MFLYITNVCTHFCHDLRRKDNEAITLLTTRQYFCQQKILIRFSIVTSVRLVVTGFLFRFISIIKRLLLRSLSVNPSMILNFQEDIECFEHWCRPVFQLYVENSCSHRTHYNEYVPVEQFDYTFVIVFRFCVTKINPVYMKSTITQ